MRIKNNLAAVDERKKVKGCNLDLKALAPEEIAILFRKRMRHGTKPDEVGKFCRLYGITANELWDIVEGDDNEFMDNTIRVVREGLVYLYDQLDKIRLDYLPTQTNFFLIKVPTDAKKIYNLMLQKGVIVRSMDSYGLNNYIRINVGLPKENERFIETLREVLTRIG